MNKMEFNPTNTLRSAQPGVCDSCAGDPRDLVFGEDPGGFVLRRKCRSPLFYCDLGGQG